MICGLRSQFLGKLRRKMGWKLIEMPQLDKGLIKSVKDCLTARRKFRQDWGHDEQSLKDERWSNGANSARKYRERPR
jgi:hypothetical protein